MCHAVRGLHHDDAAVSDEFTQFSVGRVGASLQNDGQQLMCNMDGAVHPRAHHDHVPNGV